MKNKVKQYEITCLVGSTGSGKTSVAQWIVLESNKKNIPVWSNVDLKGAYVLDFKDLMKVNFLDNTQNEGVFIIDEAGIEFNNRNWEGLSRDIIKFFKLHRHFKINIYIFSQGEDIDITFRRLSHKWYKIYKPWYGFGKWSALIPVTTQLVIENGKWCLQYEADNNIFSRKHIPIWKTWNFFDSFSTPKLPVGTFSKWGEEFEDEQDNKVNSILSKIHY